MSKTKLEQQVAELEATLRDLAERVRLDAVAEGFLCGNHEIREGDCFLYYGETPTRLSNVSSEGKWTFWNGQHVIEPHVIPRQEDHTRLYTPAEVAEIVAKARKL